MAEQVPAGGRETPGVGLATAERALHVVRGDEVPQPVVLLATKLQAPTRRAALVPRRRLVALLDQGSPGQLTVVNAPAGWGKTSLLAEWHAAAANPASFAWLALDSTDNDPVRFWTYVIEALRLVKPGIGERALAALGAPGTRATDITLPALVNDLAALGSPVVLVLDDYHLVTNAEVREAMAFLVEHLPPTLHLVVATRHDPPLPMARLRVRRQVVEVRANDLRFTEQETFDLLNAVFSLGLDPTDTASLHRRTEGWAAGLRLAALSLRGRSDASAFISAFAGDDRHIVDYLGSEVLNAQPPPVRQFLLRTSILERLSGPVCDAVLVASGSARMLETIERENLFLVPLDNRREWYRYHHLFAELLRHELHRTEPQLEPELHRRASTWCQEAGLVGEAIDHAIAAHAVDVAGELIARHWPTFLAFAQHETVAGWLNTLPDTAVRADARLCLVQGWLALMQQRLDQAAAWIAEAESAPAAAPPGDGSASFASNAAILGGFVHQHRGDVTRAYAAARRATELERDGRPLWQGTARLLMEASRWLTGETEGVASGLEEAARLGIAGGNPLCAVYGFGFRALVSTAAGRFDTAAAALDDFDAVLAEAPGLAEHFGAALGLAARARLLCRHGDVRGAVALADRALELTLRGSSRTDWVLVHVVAAEARRALGDRAAAEDHLLRARNLVAGLPDPGILPDVVGQAERTSSSRSAPPEAQSGAAPAQGWPVEALSDRERDVLRYLAGPMSLREIGAALYVSLNTVKTHARGVYRKLGVTSREEAVARARDLGLC